MRAVLTYHSIDGSGSPVSVDEAAFRAHLRWLAQGPARVVTVTELLELDPRADAVAVTFDDALASFGDLAAPALLDAGLPVTVFVVSDRVGTTNAWGGPRDHRAVPELPLLEWDRLGELASRGVELGAHTRTHPDLTTLERTRVVDELAGSAERIRAETGRRPRTFAYPYGAHDPTSVEVARGLFEAAVTAELGLVPDDGIDRHRIPRLDMVYFRDPARLEAWGTPAFGRWLALRRAGRRVGAALRGMRWRPDAGAGPGGAVGTVVVGEAP